MKKVSVIGGGLAGLTAGIYLLENNYDVCIYEKNHCAGGFLTGWMRKNQLIDGCIHWMIGTANDSKINEICWDDFVGKAKNGHFLFICQTD